MTKQKYIAPYSLDALWAALNATDGSEWRTAKHPDMDATTLTSDFGYVIHPGRGYLNDDNDARFMATFNPARVRLILDRLTELERLAADD